MIELGAGFNTELTGFENIVMYGTLLGRTPQLMRDRAEEIADWADLSDYLDVPTPELLVGNAGSPRFLGCHRYRAPRADR